MALDSNDFSLSNPWDTSGFDLGQFDFGSDFDGFNLGGFGNTDFGLGEFGNMSGDWVYDTETGQFLSPQQAQQVDPAAFTDFVRINGQIGGGGNQSSAIDTFLHGKNGNGGLLSPGGLGLATTGIGSLVGLAGVIQRAFQGDQQATQEVQRIVAAASPQERAALNSALAGLQGLQNYAFSDPASVQAQLGSRMPIEESLFNQSASGLSGQQAQLSSMLMGTPGTAATPERTVTTGGPSPVSGVTAVPSQMGNMQLLEVAGKRYIYDPSTGSLTQDTPRGLGTGTNQTSQFSPTSANQWDFDPATGTLSARGSTTQTIPGTAAVPGTEGLVQQLLGAVPGMSNQQSDILSAFGPTMQGIAAGQIPPQLAALVEQAYQPQFGDVATQAINSARERGFAGGADLLTQGPAGALAGPALSNLQGQMANSKLGLLTALPQAVATASGAYSTPLALRGQLGTNLSNLNQNLLASLGGIGQQGMENRLNFIGRGAGVVNAGSNLAQGQQAGRLGSAGSITRSTQPTSLLDSFAPLASVLGGFGGALSGYGATLNRPSVF